MDNQKTGSNEGFLTKIYKDFFLTNSEKNAIDKNMKTADILDKKDGIFGVSENNVFNVSTKNDFPGLKKETTIFDMQKDPKFAEQVEKPKKPDNGRLNSEFLKNLSLNRGEAPPEQGNRLDQTG